VQGTKTQAAIAKFINDRKFPPDTRSGENFFDVLIEAARNPDWCRLLLVQRHQLCGDGLARPRVTLGWYRVVAGQCVRPDVRGDPYKLYSYAEAVDANGRAVKRGDTPIAWGGTVALCTRDGRFELADHKDCAHAV
jgi:Protein of unknown function (DUF1036)